jgi:nitrous oxidase accessory protein
MRIFICFSILVTFAFGASSKTIIVGKSQKVTSIKKALQLSQTNDTVLVEPGMYREGNLTINKSLVLKGINYPVLDGEKKFEIISIKANNVTVSGFKIQRSGRAAIDDVAGIKIYNAKNVLVINNILDDNNFGIYTQNGRSCTIKNNIIKAYGTEELQSGNGIHCWRCDSMLIIANTVIGHRDGIYFEFVTNSTIWRNTSAKNVRYGLHFMFSQDDSYIANTFTNNGAGVAVMYSHGVKMFNNSFQDNWGDAAYGILLKDISDSYIEGNHFLKNTIGIHMDGSSRILLGKNKFLKNGWAIRIQANCDNNVLEKNNFMGNTFDVATNGSLVLNTFRNNYWDKYEGYDLNRDKIGDIPYHPVAIYSMIIDQNPSTLILFRSFIVSLLDKSEKILPSITPEDLKDAYPLMTPLPL